MRWKLFIVLLFLIQPVTASSFSWSRSMDIELSVTGSITLTSNYGDTAESLTANLTMFPTEADILSENYYPENYEKGDGYVFYTWSKPHVGVKKFGYDMTIRNTNQFQPVYEKQKFPTDYSGPYIEPTDNIEINDETKQIASEIASGKDDLYEVVFDIGKWVNENMVYDLAYGQTIEKTSTILKTKRGVCDEYSNLYIALLRSIGIPARYVGGIAYTNVEDEFSSHGWVEVLIDGQWIPFDATYRQFGHIDTTHIKLQTSRDVGKSAVRYWLSGAGFDLKPGELVSSAKEVSLDGDLKKDVNLDLNLVQRQVGIGSYDLVEATVTNLEDYYNPVVVYLSKAPDVVGTNAKPTLLKPHEVKKLYWTIKIPDDLDTKFVYTYRIQASTLENWTSFEDMEVSTRNTVYSLDQMKVEEQGSTKNYNHNISFSCETENVLEPSPAEITCHLKNTGNVVLTDLDVCIKDQCQTENLFIGEERDVVLDYYNYTVGENRVTVTLSNPKLSRSSDILFTVSEPSIVDRLMQLISSLFSRFKSITGSFISTRLEKINVKLPDISIQ